MSAREPRAGRRRLLCSGGALAALALAAAWLAALLRGGEDHERPPDTVLVVLADHLCAERLGAYGAAPDPTPRISALAAESVVFQDAVTGHLATNSALGSVLAGAAPDVLALGRHGLPPGTDTLAAAFQRAGYETVAAVSLRQLAGSITGYDQGFDVYSSASAPEGGGPAAVAAAAGELERLLLPALERGTPVFALFHAGALRTGQPADAAAALPFLERALAPFLESEPELCAALGDPAAAAAARVGRVREALERRRGAPEWRALRGALYDAALAELDAAVGQLLDRLERHGRLDGAWIVLAGVQAAQIEELNGSAGEEGPPLELRVPFIVRPPGGEHAGTSAAPVSTASLGPTLRAWLGGGEPVLVELGEQALPARAGPACQIVSDRDALPIEVQERALAPALRPGRGEVSAERRSIDPALAERELALAGGSGGPLVLALGRGGAPLSEAELLAGARPLSRSSLLRLPDPLGALVEAPPEGPAPFDVDLCREAGATRLSVAGAGVPDGAAVRVLLERYPPGDPARPLEVELETDGAVEPVPGRLDAVALAGPAPLRAVLRLAGSERPALSVAVDGAQVPVARIRYLGRRFTRGDLVLYLSEWFPEAMQDLECGREECEAALAASPEHGFALRRDPLGPGRPLSPTDLATVSKLTESE